MPIVDLGPIWKAAVVYVHAKAEFPHSLGRQRSSANWFVLLYSFCRRRNALPRASLSLSSRSGC